MESTVRISIDSISQLVLYNRSSWKCLAAELLSYKEVLFEEATEECYVQRDTIEVDWVESDCICQAEQFAHLMEEYTERFFTYMLLQSPKCLAAHLESYLLHRHYTSQLDNLYDNIEVDELEVD